MSYEQIKTMLAEGDYDGVRALVDQMDPSPFTVKEIEAAIKNATSDGWYDAGDFYDRPDNFLLTLRGVQIQPEVVSAAIEGHLGRSDEAISIFRVGEQHFRRTGYESSYSGTSWDGLLTEVEPETKTVTVYKEVRR